MISMRRGDGRSRLGDNAVSSTSSASAIATVEIDRGFDNLGGGGTGLVGSEVEE